jgi:hypothetical protein
LAIEEMRRYCAAGRRREQREEDVSPNHLVGYGNECVEDEGKLTFRIDGHITNQVLKEPHDGSGRVKLEVGETIGVGGDRDRKASRVEDDGVEEGDVVPDLAVCLDGGNPWPERRDKRREGTFRVSDIFQRRPEVLRLEDGSVVGEDDWDTVFVEVAVEKLQNRFVLPDEVIRLRKSGASS